MRLLSETFPMLNRRAVESNIVDQAVKVGEEAREVAEAVISYIRNPNPVNAAHVCEECCDSMLSAEALFCKMPDMSQAAGISRVHKKGYDREDWIDGSMSGVCRNMSDSGFICSACECEYPQHDDSNAQDFCYCPDCGKRVI